MKKIYVILIVLVVGILAATIFFLWEWNRPNKNVAELEANFQLTTAELTAAFAADPQSASDKYANAVIMLTGVIDELEEDHAGNPSAIFTHDEAEVQCTFQDDQRPEASKLKEGDKIKLKGKFTGYIAGDDFGGITLPGQAKLNNCVLVND